MASIGEQFKRERIGKKISLEDVARETKIRVSFLRAIEEDRFNLLPGGVFTRNFLRAYAIYLRMDEDEVVKSFVQLSPPSEEKKLSPLLVVEEHKRRRYFYQIAILILLILLLGYILWVKGWDFKGENVYNLQQNEKPSTIKEETAVIPERREVLPSAREPSSEASELSMELRAIDSCWVEILADDRLVAYKLLQPGEKLTFVARQRFSLTLGNAGGVEVSLNGKRLRRLGRLGEVKRSFELDAENWRQYATEDNQ